MVHRLLSGALSVERYEVAIADLPPSLAGTRIVHLTDFHYDGLRLSDWLLSDAIAASNAAEPDLVLLTGDYVTDEPEPIEDLVLHLKHLQARAGVFASLGNHDLHFPRSRNVVTSAFERVGIRVLWNDVATPLGAALPVVGLADLWSRGYRPEPVMSQLDPQRPRIVLSHNPDTAEGLQRWRADLILSGHTHGGQTFLIPGWGPIPTILQPIRRRLPKALANVLPLLRECPSVVKHWEWAQGWFSVGSNQLYVNRGLGTYLPGRVFCPPEIAIMTLVPAG
ncbi:putative phosphohydrolase [Rubidibacter lacunae KORDI 51-2]|uniref:Putative phosphohydrolase n=1 Tax=Rubidibacter lacunae KORDI 51-2 TaxID=582515 RepID=U5DTV4_9CHRO|nr:metallophosphoesterase [Rubidibacter lacunae]ERN43095.1 putative phosphohydrolase [Rubidibacter lacunae KORDI 51-2]